MKKAAVASRRLIEKNNATFSGALLWHTWHPWHQAPKGLVEIGFEELAKRWLQLIDVFDENGVFKYMKSILEKIFMMELLLKDAFKATKNHKRSDISPMISKAFYSSTT